MARYGDYETDRQLASRGLTSVYLARRVAGSGPKTAVVKVLRLPEELPGGGGDAAARAASATTPPAAAEAPAPARSVFISHSTSDKAKADAVCAALEQAGVSCWIAPRDILPGANWATSILRAIGESRLMVLLLSERANDSPHIRREVERAVSRNVPIAPVRVQDVMPRDDMEYFLSASHWVDAITEPFEMHLPHLVEDIRALLKAQAAPEPGGPQTLGTAARVPASATAARPASAFPSVARAALEQFLEVARVQRRVAEASSYWAFVHDFGEFPGGGFAITDHCRHSVQRCIEAGDPVDAAALHAIATGVVIGLADFHRATGRPHGDVEPSNVLLRADPGKPLPAGVELVALTDPLSAAQLTPRHTIAADLRHVGRLIYQLVAGETPEDEIPEAVAASPAWRALGAGWQQWADLCTLMLSAPPGSALTTDAVRERLEKLGRPAREPQRPARAAVGAVTAAVAVVALAVPVVWLATRGFNPAATDAAARAAPAATAGNAPGGGGGGPVAPAVTPATPKSVKEHLVVAANSAQPFKVELTARQEPCAAGGWDCVTFTVRSDRPGYVILLTRDPKGQVDLLVPNQANVHLEEIKPGSNPLPAPDCQYEFPVEEPYGKTWFKAVVTTRPIELVTPGAAAAAEATQSGAMLESTALRLSAGGREARTLAELLGPDEWATAECEIFTHRPAGKDAGGAGAPAEPAAAAAR